LTRLRRLPPPVPRPLPGSRTSIPSARSGGSWASATFVKSDEGRRPLAWGARSGASPTTSRQGHCFQKKGSQSWDTFSGRCLFRLAARGSGGSGISRRAAAASSFRPPSPRRRCLSRCRTPTGSPALPERPLDHKLGQHLLVIFSNSRSGGSPIFWLRSCRCRNDGYVGRGELLLSVPYRLPPLLVARTDSTFGTGRPSPAVSF
jgi:hypothetical protein